MPWLCRKSNQLNDVLKFDTAAQEWRSGFSRPPFEPLAYHSATLVNHELWVIGGNNGKSAVYGGLHVLDTKSLLWRTVHVRCAGVAAQASHAFLAASLLVAACRQPSGCRLLIHLVQGWHKVAAALCTHLCASSYTAASSPNIWWVW